MNYLLQRRQTLAQNLKKNSLDAFLVTSAVNVTYLTGFTGDASFYAGLPRHGVLVSDPRFEEQIKEECFGLEEGGKEADHPTAYPRAIRAKAPGKDEGLEAYIRPHNKTTYEAAADVLTKAGAKTVGIEGNRLTLGELELLKGVAPKVTFVPIDGMVEAQRVIKDPSEVAKLREAVQVAE